jgi:hypothetical protein
VVRICRPLCTLDAYDEGSSSRSDAAPRVRQGAAVNRERRGIYALRSARSGTRPRRESPLRDPHRLDGITIGSITLRRHDSQQGTTVCP